MQIKSLFKEERATEFVREDKITEDGGVIKKVITEGKAGALPKKTSCVTVEFIGRLEDGTIFDKSQESTPSIFDIDVGQLVKGWDLGIQSMKTGEKAEIVIKPEYAYGEKGFDKAVPANATLYYTTYLMKIDTKLKK